MRNLEIRTIASLMLCAAFLFAFNPGRVVFAQIPSEESSPSAEQTPSEFPGTYIFEWPDGRSVAEVELHGSELMATMVISGGYTVHLRGTVQGNSAHGKIVGKSGNGDFGDFDATINQNALQLMLRPKQAEPLDLIFKRATAAALQTLDPDAPPSPAPEEAVGDTFPDATVPDQVPEEAGIDTPAETTVPDDELASSAPEEAPVEEPAETTVPDEPSNSNPEGAGGDDRLIGTWVYQSLVTSGDSSYASERFQIFRADGTYSYGNGSTVAGGGGWSYNGGNGEGETENGFWRAQDGVLYTAGSNGQWYRIGKYGMTDDGSTMRITYDNGNRKLWSRR